MFGTDMHACYAMSGTDLEYAATSVFGTARRAGSTLPMVLCACHAMSGTGTDCGVLRCAYGPRAFRY
eukprot:3940735-Rhodomonas_salina.6